MSDRLLFPFTPCASKTLSATTSTGSTTLALKADTNRQVVLQTISTGDVVFVNFGGSTVTASTSTSMALLPGATYRISVPPTATYIAAIVGTTTTTLYITEGYGN